MNIGVSAGTARIRDWNYRRRFPGANIGSLCKITRCSRIDQGVELGDHASLHAARLSGGSQIGHHFSGGPGSVVGNSHLGHHCTLESEAEVYGSRLDGWNVLQRGASITQVSMGAYSYVARRTSLNRATVGRFCSIGPGSIIGSGEHPTSWASSAPVFYSTLKQCGTSFVEHDFFTERVSITIGHDVCIGAHCFIRDGVNISDGAFLAAGSVVVSDVPAYAIVGGVPARTLRYRFDEPTRAQLRSIAWWTWDEVELRSASQMFVDADVGKLIAWAEIRSKLAR